MGIDSMSGIELILIDVYMQGVESVLSADAPSLEDVIFEAKERLMKNNEL